MTLTAKDITDLERMEDEIEEDQSSFFRMADNLVQIKTRKLYLREYKTFEGYCQQRWGWTPQWVNQQIRNAKIVRELPEKTMETLVSKSVRGLTESTTRAVAGLAPESRIEVIEHAAKKPEPMSSRTIKESAKEVAKAKKSDEPPVRRDETGWPIPDNRVVLFDRAPNVERMLQKLADVRGFVRRAMDAGNDPLFHEVNLSGVYHQLDGVYADLKRAIPHAVCPMCQGIKANSCKTCKGGGFVSRFLWDTAIPSELKEIRRKTLEDK